MEFENTFEVDAPIDEVYAALMDVERVAPCVPGAQVLEKTADDAYQVGIKVKVGPMSMLYKGTVEIVSSDPVAHEATMRARARESRGQGMADAQVQMALSGDDGSTKGTIHSDVKLSGKVAAMGGGVIREVSGKLVDQFARNLEEMLGSGGAKTTPEAAAAAEPATPTAESPAPAAEPAAAEGVASEGAASAASAGAQPTPSAAAAAGPATPTQPAPSTEPEALEVGGLIGPLIASRLRDPKVLGGLGLVLAALAVVLLRRRR